MRIKIGPYRNWIGPYQIAKAIFFWTERHPDDKLMERWDYKLEDKFGDWLAKDKDGNDSRLTKFCVWLDSKRQRNIKIHIDPWDTWSLDHTLSLIVVPMLKQLQATKHGAPLVDDEDVPEYLRSTAAPAKENDWDIDGNHFKRWDWVMDEMIWAFEQIADTDSEDKFFEYPTEKFDDVNERISAIKMDKEGLDKHNARIANGLRLFAKYYRGLWD